MKIFIFILLFISILNAAKIEFEVLGSGGPELDGRASTSYLLWIDNKARLIVDMGSGSMLRFEESGAKLEDLEAVVLTHLHIDHCVELPSFAKAGYFTRRTQKLDIIGPKANEFFPSISEYLQILFGKKGAYKYMNDVLSARSDSFELIPLEVSSKRIQSYKYRDFTLKIIAVHHGRVPALALRIEVDSKVIVISGDTNNQDEKLQKIAKNADLFVAHHAIPEYAGKYAKQLHMDPQMIAKVAKDARVKKVLLTHRMRRTLGEEEHSRKIIEKNFAGEVIFAEDKMKIEIL